MALPTRSTTRASAKARSAPISISVAPVRSSLRAYGEAERYNQTFSSVATDRNSESLTDVQGVPSQGIGGSAVWSRAVGKRQTLVAGVDDHQEIGHSNEGIFNSGTNLRDTFTGGHQNTVGVFGEDLIQIAPRWLLSASARYDHWSNTNAFFLCNPIAGTCPANTSFPDRTYDAFSPRLTLQHQFNSNVSWNASIYRAFRAPTLNELYRSFRQGNTLTNANPNLRSEELTGGDASLAVNGFQHKLEARGTFFFNEIIDPVANVTLSSTPTLITRQRQNLGRTRAPGFEIDATAHFTRELSLSVGYQYVDAIVTSFPDATPSLVGLWVAQVPHNVLTFQGRYLNPSRINISVNGRMVGKQYDDDQNMFPLGRFFVLDAMAWRTIGHGVDLFTAAENLFNVKYATAATPVTQLGLPITARFGLRFEWPAPLTNQHPFVPFYRLLEFCMLLNSGYLVRVLIAEPWIRNAVRMMRVVTRGEQTSASITFSASFRFRGMRVRFHRLVSSRVHFPGSPESSGPRNQASTGREASWGRRSTTG